VKIKKRGTGGYDEIPILADQVDKAKVVRLKRAGDKLDDFVQMNALQHADDKEVPKIAAKTSILPIALMEKDDRFKARFDKGGYDPTLIKVELSILDSQAGGNRWLLGERWYEVKRRNLHIAWGFTSWNDYKRSMIQKYSPSFIDNCISVYERFEYREALKLGAKIALITHTVEAKTEGQREDMIEKYARLPYQDALEMTRAITREDPQADKEIPTRRTDTGQIEVYQPRYSLLHPEIDPERGKISMDDQEKAGVHKYNVLFSFQIKREKEAFEEAVNKNMMKIFRTMAELMTPE
jgi:hypothetical protein